MTLTDHQFPIHNSKFTKGFTFQIQDLDRHTLSFLELKADAFTS